MLLLLFRHLHKLSPYIAPNHAHAPDSTSTPTQEAPVILSPPADTFGPVGANLTLDCEARGFPAPAISWQYDTVGQPHTASVSTI